jgi:hypothetical protein
LGGSGGEWEVVGAMVIIINYSSMSPDLKVGSNRWDQRYEPTHDEGGN